MLSLKDRLMKHLEALTGDRPDLAAKEVSSLPLFLRERYAVFSALLFGRKSIVALESEGWEIGSPAEYRTHADALNKLLNEPVVLVLPNLPSYARNRMVQMGIPFIVPGSQTYLPTGLIDLRERFPQLGLKRRDTLSPAAQCTLLYHLLRGPLADRPLKEIAQKLHYSPMMITKVKDEFEAAEICRVVRSGRSTVLNFSDTGRTLWKRVSPHLTSPVKKMRWVNWRHPAAPALLAGMSALSERTMIASERRPTYALTRTTYNDLLERGEMAGCGDAESATACIEVWSYDPRILGDDQTVDPLSLYLSLRANEDERVQQQLNLLLEEVKW